MHFLIVQKYPCNTYRNSYMKILEISCWNTVIMNFYLLLSQKNHIFLSAKKFSFVLFLNFVISIIVQKPPKLKKSKKKLKNSFFYTFFNCWKIPVQYLTQKLHEDFKNILLKYNYNEILSFTNAKRPYYFNCKKISICNFF